MQTLAAPIPCGKKRHRHLRPYRRARLVVIVIQRMSEDFFAKVAAISAQLCFGERLWSADKLAGTAAAGAALAVSVLYGLYLHVVPVRPEAAENTAVVGHVAIPIRRSFPDAHRGEMRRLKRRHMPLVDSVVRNAVESHLAVAPWLRARPFDAVVEILGLARREVIDISGRGAAAARVHSHARVALRHPLLRIDDFPALELIR